MDIQNEHNASEPPMKLGENAQGLTYEQGIAYHIIGVLILDGALDPRNFNFEDAGDNIPYIVGRIASAMHDGLEAYGWGHSIAELLDAAQKGEIHGWTPKQPVEQDGAE